MSLENLYKFGKLKRHKTSPEEIESLLGVANRCLGDASQVSISLDLRFIAAYQAALAAAEAFLYCYGYKAPKGNYHYMTWEAMRNLQDEYIRKAIVLFDDARQKRGVAFYDHADVVSEAEFKELFEEVKIFVGHIKDAIRKRFPVFGEKI